MGRPILEVRGFDMTQAEFAERIGISQNCLSTMEHGTVEIGAEILLQIGREFAKSVEWLVMGKVPTNNAPIAAATYPLQGAKTVCIL